MIKKKKLKSDSKFRSEYLIWGKFQVMISSNVTSGPSVPNRVAKDRCANEGLIFSQRTVPREHSFDIVRAFGCIRALRAWFELQGGLYSCRFMSGGPNDYAHLCVVTTCRLSCRARLNRPIGSRLVCECSRLIHACDDRSRISSSWIVPVGIRVSRGSRGSALHLGNRRRGLSSMGSAARRTRTFSRTCFESRAVLMRRKQSPDSTFHGMWMDFNRNKHRVPRPTPHAEVMNVIYGGPLVKSKRECGEYLFGNFLKYMKCFCERFHLIILFC